MGTAWARHCLFSAGWQCESQKSGIGNELDTRASFLYDSFYWFYLVWCRYPPVIITQHAHAQNAKTGVHHPHSKDAADQRRERLCPQSWGWHTAPNASRFDRRQREFHRWRKLRRHCIQLIINLKRKKKMKKTLMTLMSFVTLSTVLIFTSCNKEESGDSQFTATMESCTDIQGKTVLNGINLNWVFGDQIAIYGTGGNGIYSATPQTPATTAAFTRVSGSNVSAPCHAYYRWHEHHSSHYADLCCRFHAGGSHVCREQHQHPCFS